ncbi:MAG: TauD/TfdA family dioxygenase [Acidimicrobiales bacterium]
MPAVLEERCAWRRDDIGDDYVHRLTDDDVAELEAALEHAEAHTTATLDITAEDFPLPTLGPRLAEMARELIEGRGVALIRGVPVDRLGRDRASAVYWGIGCHLGRPWPQNHKGHLLGDVTDQGKTGADPTSRGNEIGGVAFPFHSDGSDLVGLFCLDAGASGGASLVANAVSIHNELVRSEPEMAAALYDEFAYDFRGEERAGSRAWYLMPLFTERHGRLFVRYIRPYIQAARRHADAPAPSSVAVEAMDRVDAMCADPDFHLSMQLEPGDVQLVNNYHVLHARSSYTDDRLAGRVRHLKRLWLETSVLTADDKPEAFRLGATTDAWWDASSRATGTR